MDRPSIPKRRNDGTLRRGRIMVNWKRPEMNGGGSASSAKSEAARTLAIGVAATAVATRPVNSARRPIGPNRSRPLFGFSVFTTAARLGYVPLSTVVEFV